VIRLRGRDRRSWREASFGVLDFEATGLDVERDHVVSFGFVPVEKARVELAGAIYRVVRPPIAVPPEAIRVHGIIPEELSSAPTLGEVLGELVTALDGRLLVAHAAWIELGFLERIVPERARPSPARTIDVINLAAHKHAGRLTSPRLADLAALYGLPVARTHHAFGDALTTAQLFLVLAARLEARGRGRLSDLLRAGRPQFARSFARDGLDRTRPIS
jgi:DNA polymerase-3 subunit epsilon